MRDALELLTILQRRYPTTDVRHHSLTLDGPSAQLKLVVWLEDAPPVAGPGMHPTFQRYERYLTNDDLRRSPDYVSDDIASAVFLIMNPSTVKCD